MPDEFGKRERPKKSRQPEVHETIAVTKGKEHRVPVHHPFEERFIEEPALEKSAQEDHALGRSGDQTAVGHVGREVFRDVCGRVIQVDRRRNLVGARRGPVEQIRVTQTERCEDPLLEVRGHRLFGDGLDDRAEDPIVRVRVMCLAAGAGCETGRQTPHDFDRFSGVDRAVVSGLQLVEDTFSAPRLIGFIVGEAGGLVDELGDLDSIAVVGALVDVDRTCQ